MIVWVYTRVAVTSNRRAGSVAVLATSYLASAIPLAQIVAWLTSSEPTSRGACEAPAELTLRPLRADQRQLPCRVQFGGNAADECRCGSANSSGRSVARRFQSQTTFSSNAARASLSRILSARW